MGCPKDGSGKNVNDPVSERAGVGGERAKSEREGERMRGISAHEGEKRERGGRKLKRRRKLEIEERGGCDERSRETNERLMGGRVDA